MIWKKAVMAAPLQATSKSYKFQEPDRLSLIRPPLLDQL